MIQLFIDGAEVHLPEDISIDYYVYNPFFERKGEYTYDISINLKDPVNAKVYGHLNRWNVNSKPQNRKAELYDNSKLLVSGTEVILSIEGDVAKIQLLAGNSELNYLSASDSAKMKDLDLGSIDVLDEKTALNSLYKNSLECDYVCCPIAMKQQVSYTNSFNNDLCAKRFFNNLLRPGHNEDDPNHPREDYELRFHSIPNLRAQPYLAALVEKVVEALGYSVTYNELRYHLIFSKVFIVNSTDTLKYNEMIPNWKVNDFLDEVEKWCNVVFITNALYKTCRIINVTDFYKEASSENIDDERLTDERERKYNDETSDNVSYDNLSYNLPSSPWFKYANVSDAIVKQCDIIKYEDRDSAESSTGKMIILHQEDTDTYFVARKWENSKDESDSVYFWQPINFLKDVKDEHAEETTSFKIVPAEIIGLSLRGYFWKGTGEGAGNFEFSIASLLPYAADQGYVEEEDEEDLNTMIENASEESEDVSDTMPVAIYRGVNKCLWYSQDQTSKYPEAVNGIKFPCSSVTNVETIVWGVSRGSKVFWQNDGIDLRLSNLKETVYKWNDSIDTKTEMKAFFYADQILDPKKIFVVANRRMYCKYLLYKITSKGLKREVEGVFFKM